MKKSVSLPSNFCKNQHSCVDRFHKARPAFKGGVCFFLLIHYFRCVEGSKISNHFRYLFRRDPLQYFREMTDTPPIRYRLLIDLDGYKMKAGDLLEMTENGRNFKGPNDEILLLASYVINNPDEFERVK